MPELKKKRKPRKRVVKKSPSIWKRIIAPISISSLIMAGVGGFWFLYQEIQTLSISDAVHTFQISEYGEEQVPDHIVKEERDYWDFFKKTHKGTSLGPVVQGEKLYAHWVIPRRPSCGEIQFYIILNRDKTYKATQFSNVTIPQTNQFFGKSKERYRTDARDRRVSEFESVEGLSIPKTLEPGVYWLSYTYYFLLCDHEYPSTVEGLVQPTDLVRFEVIANEKDKESILN